MDPAARLAVAVEVILIGFAGALFLIARAGDARMNAWIAAQHEPRVDMVQARISAYARAQQAAQAEAADADAERESVTA